MELSIKMFKAIETFIVFETEIYKDDFKIKKRRYK